MELVLFCPMYNEDLWNASPMNARNNINGVHPPSRGPATVRSLSEPGRAYAIYIQGGARAELVLELPAVAYKAEWIDTKAGQILPG